MTITDPTEVGTILGVWGHPDDEAYLAAAVMAVAADAGQRVVCVTLTRGELGTPDPVAWPPDKLAAERTKEMEACMRTIGVREHHWFDYPDGGCADVDPEAAIAAPGGARDRGGAGHHADLRSRRRDGPWGPHRRVRVDDGSVRAGRATRARLLYATKTPEWNREFFSLIDPADVMMVEGMQPEEMAREDLALYFRAEGALLERKLAALACQASQTGPFIDAYGEAMYRQLIAEEFFRSP